MSVCCECCVLSGRGLCDELITHTEESYRLWCVVVYYLESSWNRRPWPTGGCWAKRKKISALASEGYFTLYWDMNFKSTWLICKLINDAGII